MPFWMEDPKVTWEIRLGVDSAEGVLKARIKRKKQFNVMVSFLWRDKDFPSFLFVKSLQF